MWISVCSPAGSPGPVSRKECPGPRHTLPRDILLPLLLLLLLILLPPSPPSSRNAREVRVIRVAPYGHAEREEVRHEVRHGYRGGVSPCLRADGSPIGRNFRALRATPRRWETPRAPQEPLDLRTLIGGRKAPRPPGDASEPPPADSLKLFWAF